MNKIVLFVFICLLFVSCQNKQKERERVDYTDRIAGLACDDVKDLIKHYAGRIGRIAIAALVKDETMNNAVCDCFTPSVRNYVSGMSEDTQKSIFDNKEKREGEITKAIRQDAKQILNCYKFKGIKSIALIKKFIKKLTGYSEGNDNSESEAKDDEAKEYPKQENEDRSEKAGNDDEERKPEFNASNEKTLLYYDENWKRCKKEDAQYYRIFYYDENGNFKNPIKDYYITGELQFIGNFSTISITNEDDNIHDGLCTWYHRNGRKSQEVYYKRGKRCGIMREWNEDGDLQNKVNYKCDGNNEAKRAPSEEKK